MPSRKYKSGSRWQCPQLYVFYSLNKLIVVTKAVNRFDYNGSSQNIPLHLRSCLGVMRYDFKLPKGRLESKQHHRSELNIILPISSTLGSVMSRLITGLFKWSLEITGVSIVWYNYQSYERQQNILGMYHSLQNSYHTALCAYELYNQFKPVLQAKNDPGQYRLKLSEFKTFSAERIEQLCEQNKGAYARIGQILSKMTNVLPEDYAKVLSKLDTAEDVHSSIDYEDLKLAMTESFKKPLKEVFDALQSKPLKVGLFSQSHKAVLLENYRQVVVKVCLPSTQTQAEYDIKFINFIKGKFMNYLKQEKLSEDLSVYDEAINKAQQITQRQLNYEKQQQNFDIVKEYMYSENSATYFPTYFKKYTTKNVIIKEFIEGVSLGDHKALKEQLNVKYEAALAYVLLEVKNLMEKYQIINGDISADNIVIRKYVKPYRPASAEEPTGEAAPPKAKVELQKKKFDIIKPHYQVIFLSQKNYQPINQEVKSSIDKFWNDRHKSSIKLTPNRSNFYSNLSVFQKIKGNPRQILAQNIYFYEPLLRLCEAIPPAELPKSGKK